MRKQKVLYFCIALVIELAITLVLVNLVSKEEDVSNTLFLFGLGITIFGALINPKIYNFIRPRHTSNTRRKMGMIKGESIEVERGILVEMNILIFGLLLIFIDILSVKFSFINQLISFR